uniref:Uncharacterized protein n=1 Tax=Trypanosoma vivax (strain Y486) TaxID=1055687 RepID=G0U886_TRYVY|nr:hypothetical protein TVY486_1011390 [Trypanosoma vivax Y486]
MSNIYHHGHYKQYRSLALRSLHLFFFFFLQGTCPYLLATYFCEPRTYGLFGSLSCLFSDEFFLLSPFVWCCCIPFVTCSYARPVVTSFPSLRKASVGLRTPHRSHLCPKPLSWPPVFIQNVYACVMNCRFFCFCVAINPFFLLLCLRLLFLYFARLFVPLQRHQLEKRGNAFPLVGSRVIRWSV